MQENPNLKFATILTLRQVQIEAGRVMVENSALESKFKESVVDSCVEIPGSDVDNLN